MQVQEASLAFTDAEQALGEQLVKLAEENDRIEGYTEPHAIVMARWADRLGAHFGLRGADRTALKFAALAHDLGERVMKRDYLQRADGLSWEERLDLWRHPILGEQAAAQRGLSRQAQLLIRWHHEWWNGLGYPDALSGEAIPIGARILRLVDSYSALLLDRPYRQHFDPEAAQQIIADHAGLEFDPRVAQAFLHLLAEQKIVRSPKSEVRSQEFGVPSPESRVPDDGIQTPDFGLRTSDFGCQTPDSGLPD
jgi:HD-GYP domain-containing protein (c-di-GMP phosphodiesterase class II)